MSLREPKMEAHLLDSEKMRPRKMYVLWPQDFLPSNSPAMLKFFTLMFL